MLSVEFSKQAISIPKAANFVPVAAREAVTVCFKTDSCSLLFSQSESTYILNIGSIYHLPFMLEIDRFFPSAESNFFKV